MENYKMWVGGKWVEADSGKTYTVVNPATEEEIAQVPLGGKEDVDKAVEAARKAFPVWSKKTQDERSGILSKIAESVQKHVEEIAKLDILDHGSPLEMAYMTAGGSARHIQSAAETAKTIMGVSELRPSPNPNGLGYLQREPIGVCAVITPWNNSLLMVAGKMAGALAVGNTCVIKPPSVDSLPALKFAEILEESDLPVGAVSIVTGPGETVGRALASHPGVNMISFTGSCETGKAIMAAASNTIKRIFMELGGKNPFIVLEDADLEAAVSRGVFASFSNTGMVCGSPGRYYVHEKLYDKFVAGFVDETNKRVVVGAPEDKKTTMGPVVSAEHRDRVENYIKSGIAEGAKLVLGGKRPTEPPLNKGYYIVPTVFADVTQNMRIAREEIFGPVACFLKFSSEDEVIGLANDTNYGLSASVWTRNIAKGRRFANELQAGTVWVNNHMGNGLPWGGFKESGFGKEGGILGQQEYTQLKAISLNLL